MTEFNQSPDIQEKLDAQPSKLVAVAERLVTWGALAAGYCLLAQALFTVLEVLARKLFNYSFQGVDELGGYGLAITASLGFGLATLQLAHTRVDILLHKLPTQARAVLHVITWVVLTLVAGMLCYFSSVAINETLTYGSVANSPLQTPIWIPQSIWVAGFAIFLLSSLFMLCRAVRLLFSGNFHQLDKEFGTAVSVTDPE